MRYRTQSTFLLATLVLGLGMAGCCADPASTSATGMSTCIACPTGQPSPPEKLQACDDAKTKAKAVVAPACPDPTKCTLTNTSISECTYTTAKATASDAWDTLATVTITYTCSSK
jgi:hypothetical protein